MSLAGQVSANFVVNVPAANIHEVFSCKPNYLSTVCPEKVPGVDLLEGVWGKAGSVTCWHYVNDGKTKNSKMLLEEIDYENMKASYKAIGGSHLENYRSFYYLFHATPKGADSLVNWTLKYEKQNGNVPEPNSLLQLAVDVTKDVAANLVPQA